MTGREPLRANAQEEEEARPIPAWQATPVLQTEGRFWRLHWYDRAQTPGNPQRTRRLRINSPEVTLHPTFGRRAEAAENGLALIHAPEDLFHVTAAEFYAELWGGHPGAANKRVSLNGRSTYLLPRVGTEEEHCTYSYPAVPLKITDLVNGWNACQLALDQGKTFWGHAMIDAACLRLALTDGHARIADTGLAGFRAQPRATPLSEGEGFLLEPGLAEGFSDQIARVRYQGWYDGFDENGNRSRRDWHGFTRNGQPTAWLGSAETPPFTVTWRTTMIPAQTPVAVRAVVEFKGAPDLVYLTAARTNLTIVHPAGIVVALLPATGLPAPFWSRAEELKTCFLNVPVAPGRIEEAELHVVTWTGGAGGVKNYFQINGVHYPVAEGSSHAPTYVRLPVPPGSLREGTNRVKLLSDTEHHGIEVMRPGPALMIRYRAAE